MIALVVAMIVAFALIGPIWRLALQFGLTDRPAPHKPHAVATPYLGGAVVLLAGLPAAAVFAGHWTPPMTAIAAGAVVLGAVGLADDLRSLSPWSRLGVESVVALGLTACGLRAPITGTAWADAALTALWLVVIVNSMNLLDNSDAAFSVTVMVSMVILAIAATGGLSGLLLALAGAVGGFLVYNWPPARMFLGDAGSLSLGLVVAGSAVAVCTSLPPGPKPVAWLLLVTLAATADTATVVISRLRHGRSILQGGADHLAHRLQRAGFSKAASALFLGGLTAIGAGGGLIVLSGHLGGWTGLAAAVAAVCIITALASRISPGYGEAPAAYPIKNVPELLPRDISQTSR